VLRGEGGWSAVLQIPATVGEEERALALLEEQDVLVHPGYFFDFAREAYLVVSLLPRAAEFEEAVTRILRVL
jgi:aspartate/methionine/tyrosine aminotransferase